MQIQNYRMFYSETFSAQKRSQINEMLTTTSWVFLPLLQEQENFDILNLPAAQIFNMETLVADLVTKDDLLQILINLSLELLQRHSVVKKPSANVVKPEAGKSALLFPSLANYQTLSETDCGHKAEFDGTRQFCLSANLLRSWTITQVPQGCWGAGIYWIIVGKIPLVPLLLSGSFFALIEKHWKVLIRESERM